MRNYLKEDRLPKKLNVIFSADILNKMDTIENFNQNNIEGISQWYKYIEGLVSYISNPVIAWDYTNRFAHFPNGAIVIKELGYDVAFIVKTDRINNINYVYVFKINLYPEKYNLKTPPSLNEQRTLLRLTEHQLRCLIKQCVKNIIKKII